MDYEVPDHPEYRVWFKHYRYGTSMDIHVRFILSWYSERVARALLKEDRIAVRPLYYDHSYEPSLYGGETECYIYNPDPDYLFIVASGVAKCALIDRFCYKTGRDIAFGRAMKALKESES